MQQNHAKVGGILSIVAGGVGSLGAFLIILVGIFFVLAPGESNYRGPHGPDNFFMVMMVIYLVCGIIGLAVCALAIIGGVNALKKKNWGLALAGGIAATMAFFPCGVVAIIFIALGKPEFATPPVPPAA